MGCCNDLRAGTADLTCRAIPNKVVKFRNGRQMPTAACQCQIFTIGLGVVPIHFIALNRHLPRQARIRIDRGVAGGVIFTVTIIIVIPAGKIFISDDENGSA